ncbi:hypothetical protein BSL78_13006 [Apostichopus japonicus]|uniref:AIG1-type G domain-containing protein n=1 Tax=Stichopus japonicus TaxID=307972 RepID=A0A2G8KQ64_STIJA|nr:hypothetical protein BSL78_13006 [Apostichopus japonicus]
MRVWGWGRAVPGTFGGDFKSYCLLVFSHGDSALKDKDLDTYRKRQMVRGPDQDQKRLANLLDDLSWKMLAVDNTTSIPLEKSYYREQIVAMVDIMRTSNDLEIYTNDMFAKAQQEREAMRLKGLKKGWNPSIMSKVETILAANPSISREELKDEVIRQLQEEEEKEENDKRQQRKQKMWEDQVRDIEEEHRNLLEKAIIGIVSIAKKGFGWIVDSFF